MYLTQLRVAIEPIWDLFPKCKADKNSDLRNPIGKGLEIYGENPQRREI
jgi:hypothetical protein